MSDRKWKVAAPLAGGLVFFLVSVLLQTLFAEEPSYVSALIGGVAFTVTWLVMSRVIERRR